MYPYQDPTQPIPIRVQDLLSRMTIQEKIGLLSTHQQAVPRLGLGEWFVGTEVARGYVSRDPKSPSTVFPQPIGMASTFDPNLMEQLGEIAGIEARYYHKKDPKSHLMLWGPTVDPERDPRWGRTEEGYGEDPFLIGEMTAAYTGGMAGDDPTYRRTIPTLKHFCANNNEKERGSCSSNVTPRTLHEYYYRAFESAIVRGGAASVMTAYNELSGVPACMNPDLQTLLKDKWHLDFVVTDGADFSQNVLSHHSHKTHAEALAVCLKNGCDIMTDVDDVVAAAAEDALERGLITEADLDRAVGNALVSRIRLGHLDGDHCIYNREEPACDTMLHRAVNQCAAMEQMCLLHNRGILPLDLPKGAKVAVIGPQGAELYRDWYTGIASYGVTILDALRERLGAENVCFDDGYDIVALQMADSGRNFTVSEDGTLHLGSTEIGEREKFRLHDWDFGSMNLRACCNDRYVIEDGAYRATSKTPYEWFIKEWLKPQPYGDKIRFQGWQDNPMDVALDPKTETLRTVTAGRAEDTKLFRLVTVEDGIRRAAALAKQADVVILCLGNHPMQVARECYDRPDLELPTHQKQLLRAVQQANPNTVLTLVSSYPYALEEAQVLLPAILYTTHAGAELGNAVAETLLGGNNPAARCPITWYKSAQDLPDIMEYDIIEAERTYLYDKTTPLYPFGYGLSYSSFRYEMLQVEVKEQGVLCRLDVTNTSDRDGDEVVQVYFHTEKSRIKRPIRQLCGFQRVPVPAGETVPVTVYIPWYALERYDLVQEKMLVEGGDYTFSVGASSQDIRLTQTVTLQGQKRQNRPLGKAVLVKLYDEKSGRATALHFSMGQNDWYGCTDDWGGSFTFYDADFSAYTTAELLAAAPCSKATVTVYAGETALGKVELPAARGEDDFHRYEIPLQPYTGIADLRLEVQGMANLYRIQFC